MEGKDGFSYISEDAKKNKALDTLIIELIAALYILPVIILLLKFLKVL